MSLPKLAARLVLGYVGVVEGTTALIRFRERTAAFELATQRAAALGRRLIVLGDPDAGMHTRLMRAYDCGDVCVDLTSGSHSRPRWRGGGEPWRPERPSKVGTLQ